MSDPHKHSEDDAELTDYADLLNNLRAGQPIEPVEPSPDAWSKLQAAVNTPVEAIAPVVDLGAARERSRGRTAAVLVAVAAAFLLVAVPVGLALRGGEEDIELASAELLVLDDSVGAAPTSASLVSNGSDLALTLEADDLATEGSDFAEVWLIRVADDGSIEPVSLGRADSSGRYDVDDDLDLGETWLVDVSIEPDDGDHEHSGHSVLQGDLS